MASGQQTGPLEDDVIEVFRMVADKVYSLETLLKDKRFLETMLTMSKKTFTEKVSTAVRSASRSRARKPDKNKAGSPNSLAVPGTGSSKVSVGSTSERSRGSGASGVSGASGSSGGGRSRSKSKNAAKPREPDALDAFLTKLDDKVISDVFALTEPGVCDRWRATKDLSKQAITYLVYRCASMCALAANAKHNAIADHIAREANKTISERNTFPREAFAQRLASTVSNKPALLFNGPPEILAATSNGEVVDLLTCLPLQRGDFGVAKAFRPICVVASSVLVSVTGDDNNELTLWEMDKETGRVISETPMTSMKRHAGIIYDLVAIDQQRFASCSADHTVRMWNSRDGRELSTFTEHTGPVQRMTVLPGRAWATASQDGTVCVYNIVAGRAKHRFDRRTAQKLEQSVQVYDVAAANAAHAVAAAYSDGKLLLWSLQEGSEGTIIRVLSGSMTDTPSRPILRVACIGVQLVALARDEIVAWNLEYALSDDSSPYTPIDDRPTAGIGKFVALDEDGLLGFPDGKQWRVVDTHSHTVLTVDHPLGFFVALAL